MGAKCPHCSEEIDKLSGFVPESTLRDRLKAQGEAKDAEIGALTSEVQTLRSKASSFDALAAERDQFRDELAGLRQREERLGALDVSKLDRSLLPHVEVLYQSATAGDEQPQAFDAWLEEHGKAHPLLAPHVGKAASTPSSTLPETTPPRTAPTEQPTEQPAGPGGKITPADLRRYFAGPEFQAMDVATKRAKLAELKAHASSGSTK